MRCSTPSSGVTSAGPSHLSANAKMSARRWSHVPEGGARTRSMKTPTPFHTMLSEPTTSNTSARWRGPSEQRLDSASARSQLPRIDLAPPRLQPLLAPGVTHRDAHERIVACGDEMDRRSHECRLDGATSFERLRQVVAREALEPRPEADVTGRRVLRLQARDTLECSWDRQSRTFEQELPGEYRTVQLALREDAHAAQATS